MGQSVQVKVIDADKTKKQVSFELMDTYSFEDFDHV
jgi:ribosomal protein S1